MSSPLATPSNSSTDAHPMPFLLSVSKTSLSEEEEGEKAAKKIADIYIRVPSPLDQFEMGPLIPLQIVKPF